MPQPLPSLQSIAARITNNIETLLGIAGKRPEFRTLSRRVTQVLGIVFAGAIYLMYVFARAVGFQQFINTADEDGLYALSDEYGVPRKPATSASGAVIAVAIPGEPGATIPADTQAQNNAGFIYQTTEIVTVPAPEDRQITFNSLQNLVEEPVTPRADGDPITLSNVGGSLPTGLFEGVVYYVVGKETDGFKLALKVGGETIELIDSGTGATSYELITFVPILATTEGVVGNLAAGVVVYFSTAISGLAPSLIVAVGGISGGNDLEILDDWRERISLRKKNPPSGGTAADYVRWALEVPGVSRTWVSGAELLGAGSVTVTFVKDASDPITPTVQDRDDMYSYLVSHEDPATGLPVGIPLQAIPGLTVPELTVKDLTEPILIRIPEFPDTALQSEITASVKEFFKRNGGPTQTLYLSRLSEAISAVPAETHHEISGFTDLTVQKTEIYVITDGKIIFESYA